MRTVLLLLMVVAGLGSCRKQSVSEGEYAGTFRRSAPNATWAVAHVTLKLENGRFSGSSDMNRYPAICSGTYTRSGGKFHFASACVWTADFDWNLILDGDFNYEINGNHLRLYRSYGTTMDSYELDMQP